jgi:hypothetical protein
MHTNHVAAVWALMSRFLAFEKFSHAFGFERF